MMNNPNKTNHSATKILKAVGEVFAEKGGFVGFYLRSEVMDRRSVATANLGQS